LEHGSDDDPGAAELHRGSVADGKQSIRSLQLKEHP
jgi:hypothetical protein